MFSIYMLITQILYIAVLDPSIYLDTIIMVISKFHEFGNR